MFNRLIDDISEPESPRRLAFFVGAGTVALVLLSGIFMVCQQEMRKAEMQHTASKMQRTAIADCLEMVPGATFGSCMERVAGNNARSDAYVTTAGMADVNSGAGIESAVRATYTPVNFAYR